MAWPILIQVSVSHTDQQILASTQSPIALSVDISVELYSIYEMTSLMISAFLVFRLAFLQIWSSNLLHLKLLASYESIIFYFSSLVLNLYHIRSLYMYEDFPRCFYSALSQRPAMGGCNIATHARVLPWGIYPHAAYNQIKKMSNH